MLPTALILRNVRSWAGPDDHVIELRPLTLLFGRNNGGKSAIIRSLALLADSMGAKGLDALHMEGRLRDLEMDFDSLRWRGRGEGDEPFVTFGLRWADAPHIREVRWALAEERDWHRVVVQNLTVLGPDPLPFLDARWRITRGEEADNRLSYDLAWEGIADPGRKLAFEGLLPVDAEPRPTAVRQQFLMHLRQRLQPLASSILWLQSLRPAPARYTRWKAKIPGALDPDGRDAPRLLFGDPELRADVSSWYQAHVGVELVVEDARKREVRTLLRNRLRAAFDVDMIDGGEGLSECLSVLTALAMARRHRERGGPGIVAIEEPGSHLHPDLQRALIERACEVAASPATPRIVLETHSEHALLTVRLQVVRGLLRPDDVIIYWVRQLDDGRSAASRVEVDEQGRLRGDWPPDVFQQDLQLAAEIQDERDRHEP